MIYYKQDIYDEVAKRNDWTDADAERAVNATLDVIRDHIYDGDDVQITGFCSFKVKERKATKVNSIDGSGYVKVPKRNGVTITPGTILKLAAQHKKPKKRK